MIAPLVDGLCDPARRRRVMAGLACAYAVAWTLYGLIAKSTQDINADLAEMAIWAREPALGYPKHPPLLAYVIKAWFSIFPLTDWAYTLLATTTAGVAIYLAFELCGLWLDGEKRAAAPFLLGAIPFYNTFALKFDQNSALTPLWALTMLAFMRSLETRRPGWSVLMGLAAAAAMLTKYWSAFLLIGIALALVSDRRCLAYLRSSAPWIAALVFCVAVLPHVIWLVREGFPPLDYAALRRETHSVAEFLGSLGEYVGGTMAYTALAFLLGMIMLRLPPAQQPAAWFGAEPRLRPARFLYWTPLLLPIAVATVTRTNLLSLWSIPAFNLLPVMMLGSPLVTVSRSAVTRLAAAVTCLTLAMLAASPLIAFYILKTGPENDAAYVKQIAAVAEREWHETTSAPLRLVVGRFALADTVAFYMSDKPATYADFGDDYYSVFSHALSPWIDRTRMDRDGMVIICGVPDSSPVDTRNILVLRRCFSDMDRLTAAGPPGRRISVTLTRHWLGLTGKPKTFVIATVPPRS